VNSTFSTAAREPNTRLIVRVSPTVNVTAGVSGARRALGLLTYKPVKTTVSIVRPNAPKKANAVTRCARVGFGRSAGSGAAVGFVSIGGVVTVGPLRVLHIPGHTAGQAAFLARGVHHVDLLARQVAEAGEVGQAVGGWRGRGERHQTDDERQEQELHGVLLSGIPPDADTLLPASRGSPERELRNPETVVQAARPATAASSAGH
jgi:hypothetical protein